MDVNNEVPNRVSNEERNAILKKLAKKEPVPLEEDTKKQYEKQRQVSGGSTSDLAASMYGLVEQAIEERFEKEKAQQEEDLAQKSQIREKFTQEINMDFMRGLF